MAPFGDDEANHYTDADRTRPGYQPQTLAAAAFIDIRPCRGRVEQLYDH